MNGIKPEKKKNTLIRWVFGVLFLLLSLGMFSSSFIAGLLFLLAAVVSIPPAAKQLENKLNVRIPGVARFFVVFLLVVVAFAAMPTPTPTAVNNNTTVIATPPSTVSGSEAIVVPSEPAQVATPTPASAPQVTPTPTKTLADKEPDSNYVTTDTPTSTKTLADKEPDSNYVTTDTPTPEASNYQDTEWASSGLIQMNLISNDLSKVGNATTANNIDDLAKYGATLATDSKIALDESKSYSVSPELQPAKEKYETALYDFNQAGYYATTGANELKSGNSEQATQDIKTATSYTNLGGTYLNEAKSLLDNYNSKR